MANVGVVVSASAFPPQRRAYMPPCLDVQNTSNLIETLLPIRTWLVLLLGFTNGAMKPVIGSLENQVWRRKAIPKAVLSVEFSPPSAEG